MYSFDFKVLLGFCRYVLLFFQKRKTEKSSVPTQNGVLLSALLYVHSQAKKKENLKKIIIIKNVKVVNV